MEKANPCFCLGISVIYVSCMYVDVVIMQSCNNMIEYMVAGTVTCAHLTPLHSINLSYTSLQIKKHISVL